jgi:hypothetical protein
MRICFLSVCIMAGACASAGPEASPDLAEQQAIVGARAGDQLSNGSETYVDGRRVGGAAQDQQDSEQ